VLKNRELAASIFLFIALGFGLYGGVFIFPLFTQTLLHFTPTETGLALMPGGLATAFTALICGVLLNGPKPKVDPRVLIALGVALFVVSMWDLGHLTTSAGEADVRLALIVRGAGLGFLFTPINNVAYASLKPAEAQQASGLINLSRQLGGSFGIAILATYVTVHSQIHRVDLLANVYPGNALVDERVRMLTANLIAHGYSTEAAQRGAMALLDQQTMRQATMLSYNDAWMLLLLTFIVVSPAIFLLRKPRGGRAMPEGAH
jgi:DHA2 family multidrug resistance protein